MICIEVVASRSHVLTVASALVQCCAQTGDRLLGGRVDAETEEVIFLVRLTHDPHLSTHLTVLGEALHGGLVAAFYFSRGSVLKLSGPSMNERVRLFPFCLGDSWVPGLRNLSDVYLCISRPLLTGRQSAWLLLQEGVRWEYV